MKSKSMIKRIVVGFLCLAVVALIALSILQQIQLKKIMKAEEAKTNTSGTRVDVPTVASQPDQTNIVKATALADKEKDANKNDAGSLKNQLDAAEQELDTA